MVLPRRLQTGLPSASPVLPPPSPTAPVVLACATARAPLACAAGPSPPSVAATSGSPAAVNHHQCLIAVALLERADDGRPAAPHGNPSACQGDAIAIAPAIHITDKSFLGNSQPDPEITASKRAINGFRRVLLPKYATNYAIVATPRRAGFRPRRRGSATRPCRSWESEAGCRQPRAARK